MRFPRGQFRVEALDQAQDDVVFLFLDGAPGSLCRMGGEYRLYSQFVDPADQVRLIDAGVRQLSDNCLQTAFLGICPGPLVIPAAAYPVHFFRQVDCPKV